MLFILGILGYYKLLQIIYFRYRGDDPGREIGIIPTAIFGATAGAASVFGNTPLDVVKTRLQVIVLLPTKLLIVFTCTVRYDPITPFQIFSFRRIWTYDSSFCIVINFLMS